MTGNDNLPVTVYESLFSVLLVVFLGLFMALLG